MINNDQPVMRGVSDTSPDSSALHVAAAARFARLICEKRGDVVESDRRPQGRGAHAEEYREMRIPREKGSMHHLAAFNKQPHTKLLD